MRQLNKQFGKIKVSVPIPHLLTLQIDSYKKFLQEGVPTEERDKTVGLEGVFQTVFPIEDFNGTSSLEFVKYEIQEPKYDIPECITKGLTYEAPLRIHVRLVLYEVDDSTGTKAPKDIKEQDIYFGTIPLMTEKGTFIVNGTERVIVNQLQRSPGIIFEHDEGKTHSSHKFLYSCRIIPMRGSWLDFDFDHKDILYVRIDRRRKMPATILFKGMGMTNRDILNYFYRIETYELSQDNRVFWRVEKDLFRKEPAYADILTENGKVIVKAGKEITKAKWQRIIDAGIERIEVNPEGLFGMFLGDDIIDNFTGEIVGEIGQEFSAVILERMRSLGFKEFKILHTQGADTSSSIRDTLMLDHIEDKTKAQEEIYRRLRPSSPPTPEIAASFFDNLFRNELYYDLSLVGRYKLTQRLNLDKGLSPEEKEELKEIRTLRDEDILIAIKSLVELKDAHGPSDDID
ncbi:MAG: DNA-directed RNA polymerase subunit beta, partial [Desulfovibrionaceae bacterium]|nr:DNA-directed RNA polymerase subunit beta [Desulfovibrionaceae bacterium]